MNPFDGLLNRTVKLTDCPGASEVFVVMIGSPEPVGLPAPVVPLALTRVTPDVRLSKTSWSVPAMVLPPMLVTVTVPTYCCVTRL